MVSGDDSERCQPSWTYGKGQPYLEVPVKKAMASVKMKMKNIILCFFAPFPTHWTNFYLFLTYISYVLNFCRLAHNLQWGTHRHLASVKVS